MGAALALGIREEENALFAELSKVMEKYNHLERKFGISLVHSHFPMSANETLYETHDEQNRVLTCVVVPKSQVTEGTLVSQWQFDESGSATPSQYCCTL